ncbi:MAG TPA: SDR family oxidoreductase [Desulfurivibrio alkaliphilus]|uniref:SDR family oxidoreductase n=1 Tax=Desulfurivibrio alkaliphilus TaxID=427923 RepID=A0A7C2XGV7_9BACT|nr:SDR family oxidoreductase [Desulfurivibrio alkaliphilus]
MRILVTGATGLVGGALLSHLFDSGHEVRAALRGDGQCRTRGHVD